MKRGVLLFIGGMLSSFLALAQPGFNPYMPEREVKIKRSPIRLFLNKFSLMASTGYGRTFYSPAWEGVDILEGNGESILLENYTSDGETINYTGIRNWLNFPVSDSMATRYLPDGYRIINADSVSTAYKGSGSNIPINLSLHFDIDRFRIGAGYAFDFHKVKKLTPKGGSHVYEPGFGSTTMKRWYILLGGKVYHWEGWDYFAEIQVGKVKYNSDYNLSMLKSGLTFNFGIPIEYEFSEYFWFFVRPSVEFKRYTLNMPVRYPDSGIPQMVDFKQPAFYATFGFRIKFPEIRRCPVKSCRIQLKHVHSSREFRGQPIYKVQNPKVGENEHWRHDFDWLKGK